MSELPGFPRQGDVSRRDGPTRPPLSDTARVRAALLKLLADDPSVVRTTHVWLDDLEQVLQRPLPVGGDVSGPEALRTVVDTCLSEPFGLRTLEQAVTATAGSPETARALAHLADEWQALELLPAADWSALRALLGDLESPALPALGRQAAGGRIDGLPGHCTTAWSAFLYLLGLNVPASGLPPAAEFLLLLAEDDRFLRAHGARGTRVLGSWLDGWARSWSLEEELERARHSAHPMEGARSERLLMVQLTPDLLESDRYTLSRWVGSGHDLVPGDEQSVTADEVASAVADVIADEVRAAASPEAFTAVELILPLALLNLPADLIRRDDVAGIGMRDRPVVVRSLERLRNRASHRRWMERWNRLSASEATSSVRWNRPDEGVDGYQLYGALTSDAGLVGCVLSTPPGAGSPRGSREARAALQLGFPILLWDIEDCSRPDFRAAAEELLSPGRLAELPDRLLDLRRRSPTGARLVLLWDDPYRQPVWSGL
ncbi:effector-associated domain 2-containing protein [Streptomyces antibioticus]|uniref:VMAP-C domain-containing protein n=1 Tax=Streptomyces antibioticus TaxID=1890 RepID=UPI003674096B